MIRAGLAVACCLLALVAAGDARGDEDYLPENAVATLRHLPSLRCNLGIGCPIGSEAYKALSKAVAGDRDAQYALARLLAKGDELPRDERAAAAWYGKAAEQGHVAAALELNRRRHEGEDVPADEAKIAAALGAAIDQGDGEAMRALADMRVYGRGGPRDAEEGLSLLRHAVAAGSSAAAQDLARLYLSGAPGIPENHAEGLRWMAAAGRLGDVAAMLSLGTMYFRHPDDNVRDPAEGYRWLMRAAFADDPAAQETLSEVLADGAMQGARTIIAADPVAADTWLRLAARSPFHDNRSLRLRIESRMTAAQLEAAKQRAAEWHPRPLAEVLAMTIDGPPVGGAGRTWPSGLSARARDLLEAGGDHPEPWQRLPDFAHNEEVAAALAAIAEHCDHNGQKRCLETCREQLEFVLPPVRPGGLSAEELARYLRAHPESAVRAMRKEAATPEQAMHTWVLCARQLAPEF